MGKLPQMIYGSKIQHKLQVAFGGYRHAENCGDGEFYDMQNMSCEHYPVLSTRRPRTLMRKGEKRLDGFFVDHGVIITIADNTVFYNDIALAKTTKNGTRTLVRFGDRCILMPDKAVLNTKYRILGLLQGAELLPEIAKAYDAYAVGNDQTLEDIRVYVFDGNAWVDNGAFWQSMESSVKIESSSDSPMVTILDGIVDEESAKSNTISVQGIDDFTKYFKSGDAVKISGLTVVPENNKNAVIEEIEGHILRFSDYCFQMPTKDGTTVREYDEVGTISFERMIPEMDGCFWHDNRLWGFYQSEIFASKLGDPFNFYVFQGLSTDSYYLDTQLPGGFTAGISFGGYPVFFRENGILKIYGSKPSTYQIQDISALGVRDGGGKSLTAVGGCLIYLSQEGFMMFDGSSLPQNLNNVFGNGRCSSAVAGSDGRRCYMACVDEFRQRHLFCYDSTLGLWMREDAAKILSFGWDGALFAAVENAEGYHDIISMTENEGNLQANTQQTDEGFESYVQFGDQVDDTVHRKAVSKLLLRLWVGNGAQVHVKIRYDDEEWITVQTIDSGNKRTVQMCVKPRRCDHYNIRIEGVGQWKLYSMAKEYYVGSAIH